MLCRAVQELKRKGVEPELASTAVRNFFGEKGQLQSGRQDAEDAEGDEGEAGEALRALALRCCCCCLHAGDALRVIATACQHARARHVFAYTRTNCGAAAGILLAVQPKPRVATASASNESSEVSTSAEAGAGWHRRQLSCPASTRSLTCMCTAALCRARPAGHADRAGGQEGGSHGGPATREAKVRGLWGSKERTG